VVVVGHPGEAQADVEPEHVVLAYSAPPECPQEAAFLAALDARRREAPPAAGDRESRPLVGRSFDVHVERTGEGRFRGTLRVTEGDDVRERTAEEAQCKGLIRVLAVFTALAIDVDPEAERSVAPAPVTPRPPPPAVALADPLDIPPGVEPLSDSSLEIRHVPSMVRVGVSLAFRTDFSSANAGTLMLDLSRERPYGWSPAMRIGGVVAGSTWSFGQAPDGSPLASGSNVVRAAVLDLCPLRYDFIDVYVQSCLRGELGSIEVDADYPWLDRFGYWNDWTPTKQTEWASIGATVGLRGNLGRYFFLDIEAGVSEPLNRVRVDIGNGQEGYATNVRGWLGLGFGAYLSAIKIPSGAH
jgi:hypothetical protein